MRQLQTRLLGERIVFLGAIVFLGPIAVLIALGIIVSPLPLAADNVAEVLPSAQHRFSSPEVGEVPDFQRHVVPLLGRLGCNGRSCHGSFQGSGGLRLSLFGYDFLADHQAITANSSSAEGERRLNLQLPEKSLVLKKPTMQIDHEGGERFAVDSWQYHLLRRWIEGGAPGTKYPHVLSHLEVEPSEVLDSPQSPIVPLRVVAVWKDSRREDVTALCRFRTNDESVATVDQNGRIRFVGTGDTHVVVFYDNGIESIPVLRAQNASAEIVNSQTRASSARDGVDSLVKRKLNKLGIVPSERCTDTEFLRRVSIDLTGTLPAPNEIVAFLNDSEGDKRAKKVAELLERPAYAAYWANRLCDFTGCNPSQQAELGQETSAQWYQWIYERVRANVPYDEIIKGIVLAKSRQSDQTYDAYAQRVSEYFRSEAPTDFSRHPNMPHYWTRRSMQKPEDAAQAFAHNFLGIRLQCAQCHKHPFAPWTQNDFKEFSRFFKTVKFGVAPQSISRYRELAKQVGLNVRNDNGASVSSQVLKQAQRGRTIPWRELFLLPREGSETINLLQSRDVIIEGNQDPREPIMRWMREPSNPWFAKAFVNRIWASYFHVGLIDPPDDLNPANPPSNPALLEWLAEGLIENEFDMKWLHRQIVLSETYQRSWKPNTTNQEDRHNYSRAVPRRLPAEVVYDGVKQALAASDKAEQVRTDLTRRAIGELSMRLAGTYAMQVFGKPDRAVNCDCERNNQPNLLQSIFLQNDPLIDQRLADSGWLSEISNRTQVPPSEAETEQLVKAAWLRTLSRPPTNKEMSRALEHLRQADSVTDGLRDLLWALFNTKEFILIQ